VALVLPITIAWMASGWLFYSETQETKQYSAYSQYLLIVLLSAFWLTVAADLRHTKVFVVSGTASTFESAVVDSRYEVGGEAITSIVAENDNKTSFSITDEEDEDL
jgi:hypothetical protein